MAFVMWRIKPLCVHGMAHRVTPSWVLQGGWVGAGAVAATGVSFC